MSHFLELSPPIFNKLFNMITDPISILENGVFIECNYATLKMLKMNSREDLIGKTPWQMSPEYQSDGQLSVEKAKMMIAKSVAEGSNRFEWEHTRFDGSVFTAEIVLTPILEMNIETVFVIWRDISDKVKAKKAVEEIETKYKTITEDAPTAILIHQNGKWVYANKAVEEMFGIAREKLLGEDIFKYVHPSQRNQIIENAAKRIAGEPIPERYDMCVSTPAEAEKWLDTKVSMITLDGDSAILVNCLDVTKRVDAERKLRESRERYKTTLNSIGDAVIATDALGNVQMMNPVAEQLTGWKIGEAKGEPLETVFVISNAFTGEKVENPVTKVLKAGDIVGLANHTVLKSRNGNEYQIADSGSPIKDEFGNIRGVVLVFRDVTEKYVIEEQLRQTQKMEAIGQLASGLAHDFNNMLAGIIGSAEIVADLIKGNSEAEAFTGRIKEAAMNANNLTRQLLDFSRKTKHEFVQINLSQLVSSAIDLVRSSIDPKITVTKLVDDEGLKLNGDKTKLQNALINLIFNARDAMPQGGVIEISVTEHIIREHVVCRLLLPPGQYARISVKDTGTGIDEKIIGRIFDPYFTTKPAGKGTGLGLAMVQKTVTAHKGAVTVTSKPGEGSVFEVYLPAEE
ncbi:MAG TPA: PAS domain S-box protein [bacterium]|nr:PAS domain S-box protein [bacterium]